MLLCRYFREQLQQRIWGTSLFQKGPIGSCSVTTMPVSYIWELDINFFFFLVLAVGSQFSNQVSNPYPLHWKVGIFTTGPPGKSPKCNNNLSYIFYFLSSSQGLPMGNNEVGAFSFLLPCHVPSGVYISQVFQSLNCHGRKQMTALFQRHQSRAK